MPTPPISLCIIAGNVERYIDRFIDSFRPLVDEIIVVRAIGDQNPDRTLNRASEKGCRIGEYENADDERELMHVDDFAAARNYAFSLTLHDWIMWADTDDVIDDASIARIRESFAAHHHQADAFSFAYSVPEDGLTVIKDRIVRKGLFTWRHRVHEELVAVNPDDAIYTTVSGATITHMPSGTRKPNDQRNVYLLEKMVREGSATTGHKFHLMHSLRAIGRHDDALKQATHLLACHDLGHEERFEVLMALGQMCPDVQQRGQLFLQALRLNPARREAYGELAVNCAQLAQWKEMLGFTTAMMAIPAPRDYVWNHRAPYYGHAGLRLHAIALRANGQPETADTLQLNHFTAHGAVISLLHATRGRSKMAMQAQHTWLSRAADPDAIEHIFAIDADDESAAPLAVNNCVVVPPGGGCVAAWNAAAARSSGQVLIQLSDDWNPPMHWDKLIRERLGDLSESKVLAISDGHREDALLCMAILTRTRYREQGYLFHPDFLSVFSDDWFTHCAYRDGVVIDARDIVIEHQHPLFTGASLDATTAASNAPERYEHGKAVMERLMQEHS